MSDGIEKSGDPQGESDNPCEHTAEAESNKSAELNKNAPQRIMTLSNFLTLLFTFFLVISAFLTFGAICVQAFIYYRQLHEMEKASKATAKAAKAAEDGVRFARESAHLDQRAWIATTEITSGLPEVDKEFVVRVKIKNTGKTFGRSVKVSHLIRVITKGQATPNFDEIEATEIPQSRSVALLAPNGEYAAIATSGKKVQQSDTENVRSGELKVFVFGKITYDDIFNCPHWTTFCSVLRADGLYDVWETHNDADNNRCP